MIHYTLSCQDGHEFDGWFASGQAFSEQQSRGLISCTVCGTTQVEKALMAPGIVGQRTDNVVDPGPPACNVASSAESAQLEMARALRAHIETHSHNVGHRFAEEARRIHFSEAPPRSIHGEATRDDVQTLLEEGIKIFPLPQLPEDMN